MPVAGEEGEMGAVVLAATAGLAGMADGDTAVLAAAGGAPVVVARGTLGDSL